MELEDQKSIVSLINELCRADPILDAVNKGLQSEWAPDRPPPTVTAAALSHALVEHLALLDEFSLTSIFQAIENAIREGDEETRAAAATGFLESLLGNASAGKFDFRRIARYLGPMSREHCKAWDKFTGVVTDGLWDADA